MRRTGKATLKKSQRVAVSDGKRTIVGVTVKRLGRGQVLIEFDVDESLRIRRSVTAESPPKRIG